MIYFHNPHYTVFYGLNVFNTLTRRFNHNKYWYLGKYLLERPQEDVGILINLNQNSFSMLFTYKLPPLNRLVTLLELAAWFVLNRVNPFRVRLRFSARDLKPSDVVVVFAFDNLQRPVSLLEDLAQAPCVKVVHLTHYMLDTASIARHAEKLGTVRFVAESNLAKYPYFRRHFPYYKKDAYLLPFIPQERFKRKTPFAERELKCVAMGTMTLLKRAPATADLMDFFGTDCIHPMRRAIYEKRDAIGASVVSHVNFFNADAPAKDIKSGRNPAVKAYYALWNLFNAKQKSYFTFSAADLFNKYAMYVIPEEINNLPGISWAEGMACGAAFVGLDDPMYTSLGLVPGRDYIAYDNTLDGLLAAVEKYRRDKAGLERIAENGYNFVRQRLSGERAAELFISDLRRLAAQAERGVPHEQLEFPSSFAGGAA